MRLRVFLTLLLLVAGLTAAGETIALVDVNVVPMDEERVLFDQTILIEEQRITRVGPISEITIPAGARVIAGGGRWVLPGLIDAHAHVVAAHLDLYLSHGITSVRDMAGLGTVLQVRDRIDRGEMRGPRVIAGSLLVNGPNPRTPAFSVVVRTPAEGPAVVEDQRRRGISFIKLYENLSIEMFDGIVDAATTRGMRSGGHISSQVPVQHALEKVRFIEHLSGYERALALQPANGDFLPWIYMAESRVEALARLTAEKGVWNTPTLHVYAVLSRDLMGVAHRESMLENRRRFVRALRDAGARITAGSDAGYLVSAGSSLHEELRELRDAGLTNYEVLRAATAEAAALLEIDAGRIEVGRRADLVLVGSNPLDDIGVLRKPQIVIVNGEVVSYEKRRAARSR